MDVEAAEIQDWELLQPNPNLDNSGLVDSAENRSNTEVIGADSEGMVDSNYFTVDCQNRRVNTLPGADVSEAGSEASENLSLIDPGSEPRCRSKDPGGSWPDSGSDRSDDRKFEKNMDESWSDSGGIQTDGLKFEEGEEREVSSVEKDFAEQTHKNGGETRNETVETETRKAEEARKSVVWWKVPYVFLKCCVLRVSPVWTFSVAAAVMGFLILGRHFYKMRKKTRSLDIKVAMDDKKVSRFMSRAARLNEAFSAVRHVPVIRPQLPAAWAMPWPVMSLR